MKILMLFFVGLINYVVVCQQVEIQIKEMRLLLNKGYSFLPQVREICSVLKFNDTSMKNLKSIVALFDTSVIKLFTFLWLGKNYYLVVKNIFDQSYFDEENMRTCINIHNIRPSAISISSCVEMISTWVYDIITSIISFQVDKTEPDYIYSISDFQWYKSGTSFHNYQSLDFIFLNYLFTLQNGVNPMKLFESNSPWPHLVVDDMFPSNQIETIATEVDTTIENLYHLEDIQTWRSFRDYNQVKLGTADPFQMGEQTKKFIATLKSPIFLRFLEILTGISGLIPDPYDIGGGIHVIPTGGFLKVHTDFPFHSTLSLWRRVNVLIYLNQYWNTSEWGGELELWDRNCSIVLKKIAPLINRMVIFRTDNISFHGHPTPLKTPYKTNRKSIALYYYSSDIDPGDNIRTQTTYFPAITVDE
mmetsp:Transcript_19154/g.27390  ORF Transcript_19154/g.27390 Transcript_19154/m.27390 type:complete len:417 (-) Transcript_19154:1289-2539(-)